MKDTKKLRGDRAKLIHSARQLLDKAETEKRDLSSEEQSQYDKIMADSDKMYREIEMEEKLQEAEKDLNKTEDPQTRVNPETEKETRKDAKVTEEVRALAFQGWLRSQAGMELSEEHREAAAKCEINMAKKEIGISLRKDYAQCQREFRALSAVTGSSGAFTIPEGFVSNLERALLQFGNVREVAEIIRTATGNDLPWPTSNDTTNKGEIVGENITQSEQNVTFGQTTWKAYKYSSKMVKVPFELLQDSAIDLASLIGSMLGERIGRIQNDHFTTGTGTGQPRGIVNASTLGVTAAVATAIKADEVIDLIHSVDPAYRIGARFMFHDSILQAISKLKDGQGNYLLRVGLEQGLPDRIRGYPFSINQSMDSTIASGKKTMLFGQMNKYKVRDVASLRLVRMEERFADSDQIAFVAFLRSDGNLLDAGVAPVKHLVH